MKKWTTTQWIAASFLALILAGTLLLMLPVCTAQGESTGFLDALFTAASSVCVTGLVTVSTAAHWSAWGQLVIAMLIQLGGLGLITVSLMVVALMRRRFSLREKVMAQQAYGLESMADIRHVVIRVVSGTLIVEAAGALFYSLAFIPAFGFKKGLACALFNAVSAFCNAGMDLVGEESLAPYAGNLLVNLTTMVLVVLGGLGFPVWWDVIRVFREKRTSGIRNYSRFRRLKLHSKVVLVTTLGLLAGGAALFLAIEWNNPEPLGGMSVGGRITAAAFQSVTVRTAGFYTVDQGALRDASVLVALTLMLIGGSPMGTAGGVKTTSAAMLVLAMLSVLKGNRSTEVYGRRLSAESLRQALCVVMAALGIVLLASLLLLLTDGFSFEDTLYEVVSAAATVGLSRGITPELSALGKVIIICVMYIGRIGPITVMFLFFTGKGHAVKTELPEQKIMIG